KQADHHIGNIKNESVVKKPILKIETKQFSTEHSHRIYIPDLNKYGDTSLLINILHFNGINVSDIEMIKFTFFSGGKAFSYNDFYRITVADIYAS
ncbi:MAG: hypothetical protein Faunusvirus24_8, partial [Faunusvirus sp.]